MSTIDNWPRRVATEAAQHLNSSCVRGDWEISLVLSPRWVMPLRAHFTYRADDPYAAQLDFCLDTRNSVRWTFARELLTTGMLRPAGYGDVRVWPTDDGTRVSMCLESHQGEALFEIPLFPLSEWLERTYQVVPLSQEHRHLNLDTQFESLLQEDPHGPGSAFPDRASRTCEQADDTSGDRAETGYSPEGERGGTSGV